MAAEQTDDVKARFEAALAAKNAKSRTSTPHGTAPAEASAKEQADRAGGKREFRRKSGG